MQTEQDSQTPDQGSYLIGILIGCVTIILCLVLAYGVAAFSVRDLPVAIGYSVERLTPLIVVAVPIAEVAIFSKQGKRKSAIGVAVSAVVMIGFCLLFVACLAGMVCPSGSGRW